MMKGQGLPMTIMLWLLAHVCAGQVLVDKPIILEGPTQAERRVVDISDAGSATDALNARSLQFGAYGHAAVSGGSAWQASLSPAVSALTAGLRFTLHVQDGNTGPVTLTVDGLGPVDVLKDGDLPLAAGDVGPGERVSVVYDGTAFQLISARRIDRKPCPSGTLAVGELFCIELQEHDSTDFATAAIACGSQNMQLCTWGQWYVACNRATELGLQNMVGNWEWTNSPANSDGQVRVVGEASCTQAAVTNGWDVESRFFHCCFRR
jgi:VCBS repeat-containing protein